MATFDFSGLQNTAVNLIRSFGNQGQVIRVSTSYNAITGSEDNHEFFLTDGDIVTIPASSGPSSYDNRFIQDGVSSKLRYFYIAAKGLEFEPKEGDYLTFGEELFDVKGITAINTSGQDPVVYICTGESSNIESLNSMVFSQVEEEPTNSVDIRELVELLRTLTIENNSYQVTDNW